MLNQIENKLQLIELVVPGVAGGNTNSIFQFPDQPFLRQKFIISVRVFNIIDVPLSPLNNALVSVANMASAYLTLYGNDPENNGANPTFGNWMQSIPLVSLHSQANGLANGGFVYNPVQFKPRPIQWEKSSISVPVALNNTTNLSFLLLVGYQNGPTPLI